jgi:hypothetical protein
MNTQQPAGTAIPANQPITAETLPALPVTNLAEGLEAKIVSILNSTVSETETIKQLEANAISVINTTEITGIESKKEFKTLDELRKKIKGKRTDVEAKRKELKSIPLQIGKAIDGRADELKAVLSALETLCSDKTKTYTDAEQAEKERQANEARIQAEKTQTRLNWMYNSESGFQFNGLSFIHTTDATFQYTHLEITSMADELFAAMQVKAKEFALAGKIKERTIKRENALLKRGFTFNGTEGRFEYRIDNQVNVIATHQVESFDDNRWLEWREGFKLWEANIIQAQAKLDAELKAHSEAQAEPVLPPNIMLIQSESQAQPEPIQPTVPNTTQNIPESLPLQLSGSEGSFEPTLVVDTPQNIHSEIQSEYAKGYNACRNAVIELLLHQGPLTREQLIAMVQGL